MIVNHIEARCANGHTQEFHLQACTPEYAESWCGLLDGTSPMFLYPPGPESTIGKCGICGAPFKATLTSTEHIPPEEWKP